MLIYTTTEAIHRRLSGRLSIGGGSAPYGKSSVDEDLLSQLGAQVEAKVEATLRGVYRLPLKAADEDNTSSRPIVASIVEKGVICELADVHFFQGEDGNSYGREMCRQFKSELEALASRSFILPGEIEIAAGVGESANFAKAAQRAETAVEQIVW